VPSAHTAVPPVYPLPGHSFRKRQEQALYAAYREPVEWFHFGSSLHSFSTDSGNHYMGGMNAAFSKVYQNSWATPWTPPASFGAPTLYAPFCCRSATNGLASVTSLSSSYCPPNWTPMLSSDPNNNFALQFEPDGWASMPLAGRRQGAWFKQGETIKPWVLMWSKGVATGHSSLDTTWGFITRRQAAGPTGAIFGGGSVTSNVASVNIPTTDAYGASFDPNSTSHAVSELYFAATNGATGVTYTHDTSLPYYSINAFKVGANGFINAGQRWTNETSKYGICANTISLGGAKVGDFIANHSNSWPTIKAMAGNRRRIVSIGLQVNSAYNNIKAYDANTPSNSYYHLMQSFIDAMIAGLNPDAIILISDGTRVDGTGAQDTEYSQMVGADAMIADSRGGLVTVVNSRRALEMDGYGPANETLTGYTVHGSGLAWTNGRAYTAGQYVSMGDVGNIKYFRCIANHTAVTADNKPLSGKNGGTGENWLKYWVSHRNFLAAGADLATAPSDVVHSGAAGSLMKAMDYDVPLIYAGMNRGASISRAERFR